MSEVMKKFKSGDKVKLNEAGLNTHFWSNKDFDENTIFEVERVAPEYRLAFKYMGWETGMEIRTPQGFVMWTEQDHFKLA